jgi:hypothetical protein
MKNSTLDYYNLNAKSFAEGTMYVDFSKNQDEFLSNLRQEIIFLILAVVPGGTQNIFWNQG